jgi:hypothetical protein
MGADAAAALLLGRLFDRAGLRTLLIVSLLGVAAAPLAFLSGAHGAFL